MKTIALKLYDYIELADEAKTRVALHNLQYYIRGYLGDDTINDELNTNGWYFTKDGEFVSYDKVDNIIDKLELVEKAYNIEFDVEEK